jgi:DNA-directed RNA polymerase subunit beta'
MSTHNIFSPANGQPIISPSQDVVMGCYYLTMSVPEAKGDDMVFSSLEEVEMAFLAKKVHTHA